VPLETIEVHSWKRVIKEFDSLVNVSSLWVLLCSNLKRLMLILLEGNLKSHLILKKVARHILRALIHDCHTGFHDLQHGGTHQALR